MMATLLALAVLPLVLPAFSLLVFTIASMNVRTSATVPSHGALRIAVLVPAHNESVNLLPTLECLKAQLAPQDRLIVIADNCSDDTALVAERAGAEVISRNDKQRRGKGYALSFGIEHLRANPPDVVLVVDADCLLSDSALSRVAVECQRHQRPVQMLDLMQAPAHAGLKLRVLEFAMRMKNLVRPLGMSRLADTCHLMGTGMALPWSLAARLRWASAHIAEDMKLGLEAARMGRAPRFLIEARVSSTFVADSATAQAQKKRWEHGHLATLGQELPGLLRDALVRRDKALAVLAMDLMIPPLALYFLSLFSVLVLTLVGAALWAPFSAAAVVSIAGACAVALAVGIGWFGHGRDLLSMRELLALPAYALWKWPIYRDYLLGARSPWLRTRRDGETVSRSN